MATVVVSVEGLGLPLSGHSQFLLTPTDLQQNMAEPIRETGSTSVKADFRKGKYCADFEE